jgi:mRNA interferase MazF
VKRGTVILVSLDPTVGHEQRGARPCVVVTDPAVSEDQQFPMLAVIPLTGTPGEGALYPGLRPGKSGLVKPSWASIDQLRAIDKRRVIRVFGVISPEELAAVDDGLPLFLGLGFATNDHEPRGFTRHRS